MVTPRIDLPTWQASTLAELWREQLAEPREEYSPPGADASARGWLLAADLAAILEPFVTLPVHHHDLARIKGLDSRAARLLLSRLPAAELADRQNAAPTLGDLLTVIAAHPGVVTGIGYIVGPDRPDERLALEGLLIADPRLMDFDPDILPGPLPPMVHGLAEYQRLEYHEHRRSCLDSSVMRQQWYAARHGYGITGARTSPTEIDVRNIEGLGIVLRLWWT